MNERFSDDTALINPFIRRLMHVYWRATRGLTMGVRAAVLRNEEIFLVRHTYVRGWHLPGGGVEVGETVRAALARELMEEGNIALTGEPNLFGLYFNRRVSRRDHVALFVVRVFSQSAPRGPDREIAETGFFPLDDLPAGTTVGTRNRIAEIAGRSPVASDW